MNQFGENEINKVANNGLNFEDSISQDFDCAHIIGKGKFGSCWSLPCWTILVQVLNIL